jgi:hypothetical protein
MARETLSDVRQRLVVAERERDLAAREVTRLRAILSVLKAALAQAETEDAR